MGLTGENIVLNNMQMINPEQFAKILEKANALAEENAALKQMQESEAANSPEMQAFKSANNSQLAQELGDLLKKSKEAKEKKNESEKYESDGSFLDNIIGGIVNGLNNIKNALDLDEDDEPFADVLAYAPLIPRANIPGTIKEFELMNEVCA